MRYPHAEWVPWRPLSPGGRPTFYAGTNQPVAVVLHVMQGYQQTARRWAESGHFGVSWHYSIGRDGRVMQHLDHGDGGYHAGISAARAAAFPPSWTLWRGAAENVNHYTVGVEHEGFAGEQFTLPQAQASRRLCRWLAAVLDIPMDLHHFPSHALIDLRDRPNDFNTPALRAEFYDFLFAEDPVEPMKLQEIEVRLARLEGIVGANGVDVGGERLRGEAALESLHRRGISLALYADRLNAAIRAHTERHGSTAPTETTIGR
jgi:hypothetical protein